MRFKSQGWKGQIQIPKRSLRASVPSGKCQQGTSYFRETCGKIGNHHQRTQHQNRRAQPHCCWHHLSQATSFARKHRAHKGGSRHQGKLLNTSELSTPKWFLQVNLENVIYLKSQLAGQLDDARRRAEDDERRRSILEANLHQVEIELESVRVQLEEESEARLDLERQLVKSQGEVQVCSRRLELIRSKLFRKRFCRYGNLNSKLRPSPVPKKSRSCAASSALASKSKRSTLKLSSSRWTTWRSRNLVCNLKLRSSSLTWKRPTTPPGKSLLRPNKYPRTYER